MPLKNTLWICESLLGEFYSIMVILVNILGHVFQFLWGLLNSFIKKVEESRLSLEEYPSMLIFEETYLVFFFLLF